MKKNKLELPFIGIEKQGDFQIVYHEAGHHSTVFEISNPILEFSGDKEIYYTYHNLFNNIVKIIGEGYIIQKQDIFFDNLFQGTSKHKDYLSEKYFENFKGRKYKTIKTYLTITKTIKRGNFFTYNDKDFKNYVNKINKVYDLLKDNHFLPHFLNEKEVTFLFKRYLSFSFTDSRIKLDNLKAEAEKLTIRNKTLKSVNLIDIDQINFPGTIKPYITKNIGYEFPMDLMSFLSSDNDIETLIYNQVISIPNQRAAKNALERKKKRHVSMPDPANDIAVKDIDNVLENIAINNDLLIKSHFSLMLYGVEQEVETAFNSLEASLFNLGIIPSQNSYNQFELYKASIPCNASEIADYDFFETTLEPALCMFFKESKQVDENSKYQLFFSDRNGIPVAIDTADLPMRTNRINNRNKFVLGPSGSGKSFLMNHYVRQCFLYDTDIVLVDTGHSYSGICSYYGGKYITYSEENPITMNPFKVKKEEYNVEKKEFLASLIILLWKGASGETSLTEETMISNCITSYYNDYFENDKSMSYLSFNSFYDFSLGYIKNTVEKESIPFDIQSYKYITKKFYKGGEFESILNSDVDSSLFDEKFIVFEIDAIKEHKILFPITTIIIMDVFLQKMRNKPGRKSLIIEEAWKAIASPNMASYIVYLYKTVRKFFGEAVVVTQELDDIISNDIVKNSILNNSDTIFLLDQAKFKDNYDQVAELLSLNEVEKNKIFTINQLDNKENRGRFKEFYAKRGDSGEVYGVEVSMHEYLTYTTEKKEKDAIAVYLNRYENQYNFALDSFIEDLEKSQLKLNDFVDKVIEEKKLKAAI